MSDRIPSLWPLAAIEHPRCMRCNTRMALAHREPRRDGTEKRTFECQRCNFITTKIVADPLGSPSMSALTRNLKPPA
ncbi:MAG: hypothetical protein JWR89_4601 [Tardiphaga sp.]|nr:hypothetical protein [Tardiphaga sp.]